MDLLYTGWGRKKELGTLLHNLEPSEGNTWPRSPLLSLLLLLALLLMPALQKAIFLSFQPQLAFERALPLPLRTLLTLVEL